MGAKGAIEIDFGATPSAEATVSVTGQAAILATSVAEVWIMGATTSNNDESAHLFGAVSLALAAGIPSAGAGFPIYATCRAGLATGKFAVQWVWE